MKMPSTFHCLSLITLLSLSGLQAQLEGPPELIDYQGQLLDSNGDPLTAGIAKNYTVHFRIWDEQSGGNLIWAEKQVVTVTGTGLFSVRLGEGEVITNALGDALPLIGSESNLIDSFQGKNRFLGITVINPPNAVGEIQPRLAFLSSPFAAVAETARFAEYGPTGSSFSAEQIGVGTDSPSSLLHLSSPSSANLLIEADSDNINESDHPSLTFSQDGGAITTSLGFFEATNDFRLRTNNNGNGFKDAMVVTNNGNTTFSGSVSAPTITATNNLIAGNLFVDSSLFFTNQSVDAVGINQLLGNVTLNIKKTPGHASLINGVSEGGQNVFSIAEGSSNFQHRVNCDGLTSDGSVQVTNGGISVVGTDSTTAVLEARGTNQGGGMFYAGQASTFGGGFVYDGDGTPSLVGSTDHITFFRRDAGVDHVVFAYRFNSNNVTFTGSVFKPGGGSFSNSSDRRLKKEIKELDGSLDKMLKLRSVSYRYKEPEKLYASDRPYDGFIAQEVEEVFPEWVSEGPEGMKQLSITGFESLTVQAIRELREEKDAQIAERDETIKNLEERLSKLETLLSQQEVSLNDN